MVPREKITIKDFDRVAKENEFFLWHFVLDKEVPVLVNSVIDYQNPINPLHQILKMVKIPYFETYINMESIDFISYLENEFIHRVWNGKFFDAVVVGFHRKRVISHTFPPNCYCSDGIIKVIEELNPQFLLDADLS